MIKGAFIPINSIGADMLGQIIMTEMTKTMVVESGG
jgi:hypothetical protein